MMRGVSSEALVLVLILVFCIVGHADETLSIHRSLMSGNVGRITKAESNHGHILSALKSAPPHVGRSNQKRTRLSQPLDVLRSENLIRRRVQNSVKGDPKTSTNESKKYLFETTSKAARVERKINEVQDEFKSGGNSYDVAIGYFGLLRSADRVHSTHEKFIFSVLEKHGYTYKKFMHTWKTEGDFQRVWKENTTEKINYEAYKFLNPDVYSIDSQDEFMQGIKMGDYHYESDKQLTNGWGKTTTLLQNHICALESENRVFQMIKKSNDKYKYVIAIRPDIEFLSDLPINQIFPLKPKEFVISDEKHYEGYNDRFMISNYDDAYIYLTRLHEMKSGRANGGYITSEKYLKYTIHKNKCSVKKIIFPFNLIRPDGSVSEY